MVENHLFSLLADREPNRVLFALMKDRYPKKVRKVERAIKEIRRGSRVFIGTGCGEPQYLLKHLVSYPNARDMELFQILPFTLANYLDQEDFLDRFTIKAFFVSLSLRKAAEQGKINYVPAYLSEIPTLFDTKRIGLEVALIQVTPPDEHGFCSLGVSVDIAKSAVRNAELVIAQINPQMPKTWGDSFVHVDDIDILVPYEEALYQTIPPALDETARRIGYFASRLIEDGATLQVGFGKIPNAVLSFLKDKKDLGVHTQMISDGFIDLIEEGVITNKRKNFHPGKIITSLAMGTERLYRFVNNNPMVEFRPSEYVNHPNIIAQNDNLASISTALEIDVTGQVCADSLGYTFYSGMGDQVDFIRGGESVQGGGISIIAMPSTAKNGKVSRIVSHLSEGAGVTNTRADTKYVVTEYGIAQLYGKEIYQRVMELVQVAHPQFRKSLMEKAKRHHYIFQDQIAPPKEDWLALERYVTDLILADGTKIHFRPIRPSDEFMSRNFFYKLEEKSIYYRFFQNIQEWPHEKAQKWTNITYGKDMALVGIIQTEGVEEIIAIGRYTYDPETPGYAMLAFIVREDFQGKGITKFLLAHLEKIAKENSYKGFTATVMEENLPMIHILKKHYPDAEISREGGGILFIKIDFERVEPQPAEENTPEKRDKTQGNNR